MVKLIDVAKEAGVSPATVSRVLNDSMLVTEDKRQRVWDAVKELGYVPMRPLRSERTGSIARQEHEVLQDQTRIIVSICRTSNDMLTDGILWSSAKLGYRIIHLPTTEDRTADAVNALQILQALSSTGLLAGVLLHENAIMIDSALRAQLERCPVVQIGEWMDLRNSAVISVDSQQVVMDAVHYLFACGKQRPALLVQDLSIKAPISQRRQVWGYQLAMMEANRSAEDFILAEADSTPEGGIEALEELLRTKQPDAIICSSDTTAVGCIKSLLQHNIAIPEQIAVLGLEDSGAGSYLYPELSTIAAPQLQLAERAVKLLHQLIVGEVFPGVHVSCRHQLIVHDSSQEQPGAFVFQWTRQHWVSPYSSES